VGNIHIIFNIYVEVFLESRCFCLFK